MTYDSGAEFEAIITANFTHANVTGASGVPTTKHPTDKDLHTVSIRQTNGFIKIMYADLVSSDISNFSSEYEEYNLSGTIYFAGTMIGANGFLEEIKRCLNVNNLSATRAADYQLTFKLLGLIGQDLEQALFTIKVKKEAAIAT